jgi:Platelet-activating factor acetylhydrolase, isoform II
VPGFLLGNLKHVTTNAIPSAPVAAPMAGDGSGYPVLIYLEGLGAFRQMNTFQVEELVSHGYVVVAIDQPYTATNVVFPDGRQAEGLPFERTKSLASQSFLPAERAPTLNGRTFREGIVPYLAQDVSFALDRLAVLNRADRNGILTRRLDLQHVGTFGPSLGCLVGGEGCRLEPRLRACLFWMLQCLPTWSGPACSSQPCGSPGMPKTCDSKYAKQGVGRRQRSTQN